MGHRPVAVARAWLILATAAGANEPAAIMRAERSPPVPTRRSAPRLATLAVAAVVALSGAACDEAVVEDPVTPSPVASRIDAATPPPASQVAIDISLETGHPMPDGPRLDRPACS